MTRAAALLQAIADPARPRLDARRVAVVVAHPDDETIGCGASLARLDGVTVVTVTDGAPRDLADATALGFAGVADYAAARMREQDAALALAGLAPPVRLGIADQGAAGALVEIAGRLRQVLADKEVVLTHTYEGGHPDHDAVCFATHAAVGAGRIVEMPFYRLGADGGMAVQSFAEPAGVLTLELTPAERTRKQAMMDCYLSQAAVLAAFGTEAEHFRPAPAHDFRALPNSGRLWYATQPWHMTDAEWLRLTGEALRGLA